MTTTEQPKIVIVDYRMGNLGSVVNALNFLGYKALISNKKEDIECADKLILPGVGAFSVGMDNLHTLNLIPLLNNEVLVKKKPILGICLGAQLFAKKSYEGGEFEGLGWIDAEVVKINPPNPKLKIPHIGWNDITITNNSVLFKDLPEHTFYFVHSYHVQCTDKKVVTSLFEYGSDFTASIEKGNIYGTQFHPEKSQRTGLRLLKNFVEATQ